MSMHPTVPLLFVSITSVDSGTGVVETNRVYKIAIKVVRFEKSSLLRVI